MAVIDQKRVFVLREKTLRLEDLEPWEPREHKERTIAEYCKIPSREFPPILVEEQAERSKPYYIRNGHHRFYSRQDLGRKTIRAWVIPLSLRDEIGKVTGFRCEATSYLYVEWQGKVYNYSNTMWSQEKELRNEVKDPEILEIVRKELECHRA